MSKIYYRPESLFYYSFLEDDFENIKLNDSYFVYDDIFNNLFRYYAQHYSQAILLNKLKELYVKNLL